MLLRSKPYVVPKDTCATDERRTDCHHASCVLPHQETPSLASRKENNGSSSKNLFQALRSTNFFGIVLVGISGCGALQSMFSVLTTTPYLAHSASIFTKATLARSTNRYPMFENTQPQRHTGSGNIYSSIAGDSSMGAFGRPHSAVGDLGSWRQDFTAERAQTLPLDNRQRLIQKDGGLLPLPPSETAMVRSTLPRLTTPESAEDVRGVARRGGQYRLGEGLAAREDSHQVNDSRFRPLPPPSSSLKMPIAVGIMRPTAALAFGAGAGARFARTASTADKVGAGSVGSRLLGLREAEELSRRSSPTPLKRGSGSTAVDSSSPGSDHSFGGARLAGDISPDMAKGVLGLSKARHETSAAVGVVGMKRSRTGGLEEGSSALDISCRGPPPARRCTAISARDSGSASSATNSQETGRR